MESALDGQALNMLVFNTKLDLKIHISLKEHNQFLKMTLLLPRWKSSMKKNFMVSEFDLKTSHLKWRQ
jgi:hypothetical protein